MLAANLPSSTVLQTRALQGSSPDSGIVIRAALVVSLKPDRRFAEAVEVGARMDIAAEVGAVEAVGPLLFFDGIVLVPELEEAVVESVPVGRCAGRRELAANRAVTLRQHADGRPSVGVEAI